MLLCADSVLYWSSFFLEGGGGYKWPNMLEYGLIGVEHNQCFSETDFS